MEYFGRCGETRAGLFCAVYVGFHSNNEVFAMAISRKEKEENEQTFAAMFRDGEETPESVIVKVMRGQKSIMRRGKQQRITKEMVRAAEVLLPYRLPRLNSIDAQVKNVDMTHEEWLRIIEEGGK